jgi:hypothetical protein
VAFRKGDQRLPMAGTDDRIHFPIPESAPLVHNGRTVITTHPVDELAAPLIGAVPLAAALATPQMLVEIAALGFVGEDMLINPFMADGVGFLPFEPATNLFGAPILSELGVDLSPGGGVNSRFGVGLPPLEGPAVRLLRAIAPLAVVPPHLPGDGGLMDAEDLRYRRLSLLGLHEGSDLIPLLLGEP